MAQPEPTMLETVDPTGRQAILLRWLGRIVTFLAFLIIPVFLIEIDNQAGKELVDVASAASWLIWIGFAAELVLNLILADNRWIWLRQHPLELGIVVLTPPFLPSTLRAAQAFRMLRLLRLGVALKYLRNITGANGMRWATAIAAFGILLGGAAFTIAEPAQHLSAWDGVWWAITTVTTVAYGDVIPHTDAGRVVAIVVMLIGVTYVSLLTATLAQYMLARVSGTVAKAETGLETDIVRAEGDLLSALRGIEGRLANLEHRLGATPESPGKPRA